METILRRYKIIILMLFFILFICCIIAVSLKLNVKKPPMHGVYVMSLMDASKE